MGNVIQFPKCGKTVSLFGETNPDSANNWKRYCRELDALHLTEIVEKLTGYSISELRRDSRKPNAVDARQLFVLLAREHTTYSYPKIAIVLNRDHTTVMHLDKRKQSAELKTLFNAGNILADEIKKQVFGPPVA